MDGFVNAVILLFCVILLCVIIFVGGWDMGQSKLLDQCDTFGKMKSGSVVYVCHKEEKK